MNAPHRRRRLLFWSIFVVLFFAGGHALQTQRFASSDRGFHAVTGQNLPANVYATAHASHTDDNFFHETHYWIVQGPVESLRELAPAPAFARSDADAAGVLNEVWRSMPLGDANLLEGYEGSMKDERNHWLVILQPGDRAVFVY